MLWRTPCRWYGSSSGLSGKTEGSLVEVSSSDIGPCSLGVWEDCDHGVRGNLCPWRVVAGLEFASESRVWEVSHFHHLSSSHNFFAHFYKDDAITFFLYTRWGQKQVGKHLDLESHMHSYAKLLGWEQLWEDSEKLQRTEKKIKIKTQKQLMKLDIHRLDEQESIFSTQFR